MELKYYLAILWRRKWVIVITTLMASVLTAVVSNAMTPQYLATAVLWVPASTGEIGRADTVLADRLMNTYAELTTTRPVLKELEKRLNIKAGEVKDMISTDALPQTELLLVNVQNPDPQLAAEIATNLAEIVIEQTQKTDAGRSLRVSLFASAGVSEYPTWMGIIYSTPYWRQINVALGSVIGLIAGVGLVFLFEYLDTTLYTTEQIEDSAGLEMLGQIPIVKKRDQLIALNGSSPHGEAFRYLRTSILSDQETLPRTVLVTSAMPREGKSTVVANLAYVIAQSGYKVIVVDADLRLPTLHRIFNVPTEVGLSSLLKQECTLDEALQNCNIPGIQVIASGPLPANPAKLLDSPQTSTLLENLKELTDFVLIDTPAVLAVTDAVVLASFVDSAVLVVGRTQASQEAVETARRQLITANTKLIGIVVNRAARDVGYYYRYVAKAAKNVTRQTSS